MVPPTLAELPRPHPVLVFPVQEEQDITEISVGCAADFSPAEDNISILLSAQPEGVGEHDRAQWLWGDPAQALSQLFPPPGDAGKQPGALHPLPEAVLALGTSHARHVLGREGCSPSHPSFLRQK